jgi:hypothetical protein
MDSRLLEDYRNSSKRPLNRANGFWECSRARAAIGLIWE